MAQFNISRSSVPDASYKLALRQKMCSAASVQERIAALERNFLGAADTTRSSHTPKNVFERRVPAAQNVKPSSLRVQSFKPAETQTGRNSYASFSPSYPKNAVMKYALKANTDAFSETSVSFALAKPAWINYRRLESTTILKPATQESNVPSLVKVHQRTKPSLAQQSRATKEQRVTDSDNGVENTISMKHPKLPERQKPNYSRTCGTQNKVQRESMDPSVHMKSFSGVLVVGNPPPKPNRPPRVDLQPFRRNMKSLNDAPGMKIRRPVAPPPLRLCPSSNHAAALSQQVDEDESYDNVGIMNPPPLPSEDHPSKKTEADVISVMEQAQKLKRNQKSKGRKEDTNHGKVTEAKQTEPRGTIKEKKMKEKNKKTKKEEKKQKKQWKVKEKKAQKAEKFTIKGSARLIKKGKTTNDMSLNQDDCVKTESVDAGRDDLKEEKDKRGSQPDAESHRYDDTGAPAEVCSGLTAQKPEENDVYISVDNPDTRVSLLPQPNTDEDDVYEVVDSQSPPLPFHGCDIYDNIIEDQTYGNVTM